MALRTLSAAIFIKDEYEKGIEIFAAVEDVPGFGFSTSIQPTPKSYFQGPDSPLKVRGEKDFMGMYPFCIFVEACFLILLHSHAHAILVAEQERR